MKWALAFPWITDMNLANEYWLDSYIDATSHQFQVITRPKELQKFQDRRAKLTPFHEWLDYWAHANKVLQSACDGVITGFPQMPAVLGMQQNLPFSSQKPVIAWNFAVGNLSQGIRRALAQWSLHKIERFVVVTKRERKIYSDWLGLPIEKFQFVSGVDKPIPIEWQEETNEPFITVQGSAHRDFPTFFKAIEPLKIKTAIASSQVALEGMEIPTMVDTPFGISRQECWKLTQQSRFSIVPMYDRPDIPAAGIVTIVEAMLMGRPVIATRCNGAEDYVVHGKTGFLVEPNSEEELRDAIKTLWSNDALRKEMSRAAKEYAEHHFSYPGGARSLQAILDDIQQSKGVLA